MTPAGAFRVDADHPALPGHFPGRPVVPGVVLLDHVVDALLRRAPGYRAAALPSVKFLRPVLPGERVDISAGEPEAGRVAFAGAVGAAEVLRGTLLLEPAS